jgi:predicted ribosome quality control (RQC) complex YloA/Tae2 family protein
VNQETLEEIAEELSTSLTGRFLGKIYQLSAYSLAIDFGLKADGYLFLTVEPDEPRLYLIRRSVRELQKASTTLSPFAQALRASLGGGRLLSISKDQSERIVRFTFSVADELGNLHTYVLVAQLTGRSANLLLLNSAGHVALAMRTPRGEGQQVGDPYRPPTLQSRMVSEERRLTRGTSATLSAVADEHYRRLDAEHEFSRLGASLSAGLRKEIGRLKKLITNLKKDLAEHGDPETHKRLGDLLLANIGNAKRDGARVILKDYFIEGMPTVEVDVDENLSLQQAARESFSRYTKAKRAVQEIGARLVKLDGELEELEGKQRKLTKAIADRDEALLESFDERRDKTPPTRKKQKAPLTLPGMRRYRSSDGYEVLIGRTARDNDQLTFRVARPNDLWFHAGDYPGSHVIVRNSSRKEIPHRTIIEAAQLAAKFSQASKDSRVAIHYTQRKFLSKPKGAAPGLVRMSSFKTITVAPCETIERMK